MSTSNSLTHFPILSFPINFKTFNNSKFSDISCSFSSHHNLFSSSSSSRFQLSSDFMNGKFLVSRRRRRRRRMGENEIKISALRSEDGEENLSVLEQEALINGPSKLGFNFVSPDLEAILNKLSKWLVSVLFGLFLLWRHDAEAVWAAMGSVLNTVLSVALKRVLNQERPIGNLRVDPGMPSSHAQSIFYIVTFFILSMVEWLGLNEITAIFAAVSLATGSYFSWLRVAQKLHTIDQVVVGGVLGSCFSLAWWWSWNAVVSEAFNSELWVRVSILLASATCCVAFVYYVARNWLRDDR